MQQTVAAQRRYFESGATRPLTFRLEMLTRLELGLARWEEELLAALLTLDGASLTSGEVEELRRTCLAQGGMQESPGGTSPAGAR